MALPSNHLDPLGVNSRAIVPAPGNVRRATLRSASANSSANSSAMVLYNPDSYALSATQPAKKKRKTSGKKGKRVLLIFNVVSALLV